MIARLPGSEEKIGSSVSYHINICGDDDELVFDQIDVFVILFPRFDASIEYVTFDFQCCLSHFYSLKQWKSKLSYSSVFCFVLFFCRTCGLADDEQDISGDAMDEKTIQIGSF